MILGNTHIHINLLALFIDTYCEYVVCPPECQDFSSLACATVNVVKT